MDSSLAYQGYDLGIDFVLHIHKRILRDLMPDITFLVDVPIEVGLERAKARENNNRFESMPIEMHKKIRATFHKIVDKFQGCIIMINGNRTEDEVFEDILNKLKI